MAQRRRGEWAKMSDQPLARERETIERIRRLEALVRANAAPRCGARSKRTVKPCRAAAMPNGRCKVHGGKNGTTHARGPGAQPASKLEARLLLSRSEGGTVARACRNYFRSAICACWVINAPGAGESRPQKPPLVPERRGRGP
jgi:hypothetical protein